MAQKHAILPVLILSSMLMLAGCSTTPFAKSQETVFIAVPNDLLTPLPVKAVDEKTVGGVVEAYIDNTINLGIANKRLELIREWSDGQRKIYEGNLDE